MYNTHPKFYYKILGKKVRIILEILRQVKFDSHTERGNQSVTKHKEKAPNEIHKP